MYYNIHYTCITDAIIRWLITRQDFVFMPRRTPGIKFLQTVMLRAISVKLSNKRVIADSRNEA